MTAASSGTVGSTQWRRQGDVDDAAIEAGRVEASRRSPDRRRRPRRWPPASSASRAGSCGRGGPGRAAPPRSGRVREPSSSAASSSSMSSRCAGQGQQRRLERGQGLGGVAGGLAAPVRWPGGRRIPCRTRTRCGGSRARAICSSAATRNGSIGPTGFTSPSGGAMRPDQPSPGRAAAARMASCSALVGPPRCRPQVASSRCSSPRPRRPRPFGPADPAAQSRPPPGPTEQAEKALSAASNRWWPSSKTMRFRAAVSPSCFRPRAERAPSKAAWVMTRAWLATTRSARRLARMVFSTKQVR